MAKVISTMLGILTLVVFIFKLSMLLYQVVESFHSSKRTIHKLKLELETLSIALLSL